MKQAIATFLIGLTAFTTQAQTVVTKDSSGWIGGITGIYRGGDASPEEGISLNNGGKLVISDPQGVNLRSTAGVNINGVVVNNAGKVSNVANGTASNDAVNKSQLDAEATARATNDAATLNSSKGYTDSQISNTNTAVTNETQRAVNAEAVLSKETKQVGAMAMAAAAVGGAMPVGDNKTAVSAAVGNYANQTALAVGVSHFVKPNLKLFGAFSTVGGGKTGTAVGASISF